LEGEREGRGREGKAGDEKKREKNGEGKSRESVKEEEERRKPEEASERENRTEQKRKLLHTRLCFENGGEFFFGRLRSQIDDVKSGHWLVADLRFLSEKREEAKA
jgi:hypothetical protein